MMTPRIVGKGVMVETAVGGFVAAGPVFVGDAVDVRAGDAVGDGKVIAVFATAAGTLVAGCVGDCVMVGRAG
jgi:hypothetical protein